MTEEDNLRKKIIDLQSELSKKDNEINLYLDKIEGFEEEVLRYEEMFDENAPKKKIKKAKEEKLNIEIDVKDREIRELKNRMGFLRKEKMELKKKHDDLVRRTTDSSVISVEDLREKDKPPLNILLHELQDKLNKQESLIRRLKSKDFGSDEYNEKLREKDEKIELLTDKITDLTEKIENSSPQIETNQVDNNVTKNLLEELQKKLNKAKRQNDELKKVITKYEKKNKGKKGEEVVEEFKSEISKSKVQIATLQEQIKEGQNQKAPPISIPQGDVEGKLKIQREMASFLQTQLAESKTALKTKEEEITTIKNEAISIKRKYETKRSKIK
jgi:chromosome segregation ATPase